MNNAEKKPTTHCTVLRNNTVDKHAALVVDSVDISFLTLLQARIIVGNFEIEVDER